MGRKDMEIVFAIDVDSVLANIVDPWLESYNRDFNDNLTRQDLKTWDIHQYAKHECSKEKFFSYIKEDDFYDGVQPVPFAVEAMNFMWEQVNRRVIYVTDSSFTIPGAKADWLQAHGFPFDKKNYFECADKSLIAADYLVDDAPHNLENAFSEAIAYSQPWNADVESALRIDNWTRFMEGSNNE